MTDVRAEVEAILIEIFRKALMVEHHHDWDMDTITEAAHICARAWCDSFKSPALKSEHSDGNDLGAAYRRKMSTPPVLTSDDEDRVADLLQRNDEN